MIDRELADVKLFQVTELELEFADGELADSESTDGYGTEGDGSDGDGPDGCGPGGCADFYDGSCAGTESHAGIVVRVGELRRGHGSLEE